MTACTPARADDAAHRFFATARAWLDAARLERLVLAGPLQSEPGLQRLTARPLLLRGQPHLSLVSSYPTRDVTRNLPVGDALAELQALAGRAFRHVHLLGRDEELELRFTRRGHASLHRAAAAPGREVRATHDRPKLRALSLREPFLAELGVATREGELVPAMARKWRQINKFVEIVDHAIGASPLAGRSGLRVADFGSGKGYLTFALHHHLRHALDAEAQVVGVELRAELAASCQGIADRLGLGGLRFEHGDVRTRAVEPLDIMIALHACDTASDHAIHLGVRAAAKLIVVAPCCHKQLRPQLHSPAVLAPMLRHGVHLGQQADMLTDALRALLLEAHGYDVQVFEFVSLEHTSKNKMILASRRAQPLPAEPKLAQVRALQDFYAVREHCLELLLRPPAA